MGLLPPEVTGPRERIPPAELAMPEMFELLMGRPRETDPFVLDRESGTMEVKKPELPWLANGSEDCALLLPDGDEGDEGDEGD